MPKRPKDKNAPKRPQSSYFLFSNHRRKELKVTNPDKKVTEISKIIASEWKKMDDAAKKPYEKQAKELKEKYQTESTEYKKTKNYSDYQELIKKWKKNPGNGETKGKGKGKGKGKEKEKERKVAAAPKRPKDTQAPKKPQSAYFLFANDRRAKLKEGNPDKKITEIAKMLGAEWKGMSATQKKPWEDKAKTLKVAYETKLAEYQLSDSYKNFQHKLKEYQKELKNKKNSKQSDSEQSSEESESNKKSAEESEGDSGSEGSSKSSESDSESNASDKKKKKKPTAKDDSESD